MTKQAEITRPKNPENPLASSAKSRQTISTQDAVGALRRSGYLLETRIARQLDDLAQHVVMNAVFADPETKQVREVDAYAFMAENSEVHEFFEASAHLLIECINNPQPIAFFSGGRRNNSYPVTACRPAWVGPHQTEETLKIEHFHHHLRGTHATNYCTFVLKQKGEWMVTHADEQHREFTTLANLAQLSREKQLEVHEDLSRPADAMQWCAVAYICPILVVEGTLFDVTESRGGQIDLREVDHIRYTKAHIWKNARRYCPIDVVTERYFPKLLRQIEIECKRTIARMERRSEEILEAARNQPAISGDPAEDFLP